MNLVTHSSLQTFLTCPRKYYWRYVKGIVPLTTSRALAFGTLAHDMLADYHRGLGVSGALGTLARAVTDPGTRAMGRAMIKGYHARWGGEPVKYEQVEQLLPDSPGLRWHHSTWRLAGRIDGVIVMDGRRYLLETKTTSSLDENYLDHVFLDQQVLLYMHALKWTGTPVDGVCYNIIVKPRKSSRKGESEEDMLVRLAEKFTDDPAGHFHRETYHFGPDADLWAHEQLQSALSIMDPVARFDNPRLYPQNTGACNNFNMRCPYWKACLNNGATVDVDYARRPPHSELLEDAEPEPPPAGRPF